MAIIGFAMLLINALSYIFGWDIKSTAMSVLGIVFVLIGLKKAKNL